MTFARTSGAACLALAFVLSSRPAAADEKTDRAGQLFDEAKALSKEGKFETACPKYEESQRLDPGAGTQFNLADCYERMGRFATAWKTFLDLESVLVRVDDKERAATAHARAVALEGRVPRLKIVTPPDRSYDGLVISLDDAPLDRTQLAQPLPFDPGEHKLSFQAATRQPQTTNVVAIVGQVSEVTVPALSYDRPTGEQPRESPRRLIGMVTAGVGVAALGAGVVIGAIAKTQWDDATAGCTLVGDLTRCSRVGSKAEADDAKSLATVGTVVGIVGLAALATGIILWATAPKTERTVTAQRARTWTMSPFGVAGTF